MLRSNVNSEIHDHIRQVFPDHLRHVKEFMAQPSVSEGNLGVRDCAEPWRMSGHFRPQWARYYCRH